MAEACCVGERALVTGATGFIGGRLVRRLADEGWDVHAIVRRSLDDPVVKTLEPFARIWQHRDGASSLSEIVEGSQPDVVFHLASLFLATHSAADVEPLVRDNVLFGSLLLEAMHGAKRGVLVNTGSAWQHYENAGYSAVSLYAATKQAFADIAQFYAEANGFRCITVEFTDTYGAGDARAKLLPIMLRAERDGRELSMVDANVPLDLVHVDDAVEALVVAGRRAKRAADGTHEVFAVRSGQPLTMFELFAAWEQARGVGIAAKWGARPHRPREVLTPWTQGVVLPGWTPSVSLSAGLRSL